MQARNSTIKKIVSLLLTLIMLFSLLPGSVFAEEASEESQENQTTQALEATEEESQEDHETQESEDEAAQSAEANTEESSSNENSSTISESADGSFVDSNSEKADSENSSDSYSNSISGTIWLDENEDGVHDGVEKSVADYEVFLYLASNTNDTVATVKTDGSGNYIFSDLEPNDYVVGIPLSQSVSGTQYLVPMIGINGDNKFMLYETTYDAYTDTIIISENTMATDYNAGVRLPPGIQTTSVGILPGTNSSYTVNSSVIGFAGCEWWVIGNPTSGVISPSNSITLFSKNTDFGISQFSTGGTSGSLGSNYSTSILRSKMNALDTSLFSSGNTLEKSYVTTRTVDMYNSSGVDSLGYGTLANQMFWPISYQEYVTIANITVRAYGTTATYCYWLRTPLDAWDYTVHWGYYNGGVYTWSAPSYGSATNTYAVRPAFYLNTANALFVSNATGSYTKSAATLGSATMQAYTAPSGTIKFTMVNSSLALTSTTTAVGAARGGTVSFAYAGAVRGTNNSVSAAICDASGNILWYGRPVNLSGSGTASGTASITIPSTLAAGSYTLKVFNEQVNTGYYSDYASNPVSIPLTVFSTTPAAVTSSATSITAISATLNGTYNTGGVSGSVYFQYGTTTSMTSSTTSTALISSAATSRSVSITGLTSGTTYYYRMVVYVGGSYYYGSTLNFTTSTLSAAAVTSSATSITGTSATLNGTYNTGGVSGLVYFQYGTTTSMTSSTTQTTLTSSTATSRGVSVSGLTLGTTYYFRMVIYAAGRYYYGSTLNFTTLTPAAVTSSATGITGTSATLNGTYNTAGVTGTVYFQYGTSASFGSTAGSVSVTSSAATTKSTAITGLSANTSYYYRMVVYVNSAYYYGSTLTFITPPSITSLLGTPTGVATANVSAVFEAGLNNVYPSAVSIMYNDINSTTGAVTLSIGSGSAYASGFIAYDLTGLNPNTTYYLWTSETTVGGTVTYPDAATSTVSVLTYPDFTAWGVSETAIGATVSGNYYTGGSITAATVVYGTDPTLTSGSEITLTGDKNTIATGNFVYTDSGFTCDLTGLTMGVTYYIKTTVTNASGTTTSTIKSVLAGYTVTEKYVDEAGNPIAADTIDTFWPAPYSYSFSGSTAPITSGGYYRYIGYKFDSYTAGDSLDAASPNVPADVLTGDRTVYLVYENLNNMINITVPSSFYWYADATTVTSTPGVYDIKSGSYSITNNSAELNLKVSFDAYAYTSGGRTFTSAVSTSNIALNLTGDLNDSPIGDDLLNPATQYGTYTNVLYGTNYIGGGTVLPGDKRIWTYGFDGTYTGSLPGTMEVADYTATLTFSVDSTTP